jgi:hypothetical protein
MGFSRAAKILTASALVLGLLGAAAPAALAGNDDVKRSGSCSGKSTWKMKVGTDDGKLDGEYEVDQNKNGQVWRVKIFQNGDLLLKTRTTTKSPSGSFSVDFRGPNGSGTDRFKGRAVNLSSGEVCVGRVAF